MTNTVPTQIRIDADVKKQANIIFKELGMDMSGAVNIFLKQCVLRGGLPFAVEIPDYRTETIEAMEEARSIARERTGNGFHDVSQLKMTLKED